MKIVFNLRKSIDAVDTDGQTRSDCRYKQNGNSQDDCQMRTTCLFAIIYDP